jgi:signal transduction histidine kinase
MVRNWLRGLRGRLTAALVAVSVLTLAIAAAGLLLPLQHRLESDALRSLGQTAATARVAFDEISPAAVYRGSPSLDDAARNLRRRAGAEVVVINAHGDVLAGPDVLPNERFPDIAAKLRHTWRVGIKSSDTLTAAIRLHIDDRRIGLLLRKSLTDVHRAEAVVQRALLLSGLLGLLAAVVVGSLLAGRLVRRLRALRDTMAHVTDLEPGGERGVEEAASGGDEIGDLASSFAAMRRRLVEQEQARRAFVATASHELRTPLSSLSLILESVDEELASDDPDLEDARDQVARGRAQSERLVRLAADLLDLSRIDAAVPLRHEPVELSELARAVVSEFPRADLELAAPKDAWVVADPGAVVRIVRILVDNALRHAATDGPVELTVGPGTVVVRDHGPGVPAADRDVIFERFRRGTQTARGSGFGLGLAIGRELARGMGGDLRLDPTDVGARFVLEVPRAPEDVGRVT